MKLLSYSSCVSLAAVAVLASRIDYVAGITAEAHYEDTACTKLTYVNLTPGECVKSPTAGCKNLDGKGFASFCIDDAAKYYTTAFGNSTYFLVEGFTDAKCTQLTTSYALIANNTCHDINVEKGDAWAFTTTVGGDGAVDVSSTSRCSADKVYYSVGPIAKDNINTGTGISLTMYDGSVVFMKYYLITPSQQASATKPTTSSGSTDSANATISTTGESSSPRTAGYGLSASLSLVCATLVALSLVAL